MSKLTYTMQGGYRGTITENEMQVSSVIPMEGFDPTQGVGLKAQISTLIAAMPEGNLTMQALKRYFKTPLKKNAEAVFPFSSTYKYCAAVFPYNAYVLGAPGTVAGHGPHAALLAQGGLYKTLWDRQQELEHFGTEEVSA